MVSWKPWTRRRVLSRLSYGVMAGVGTLAKGCASNQLLPLGPLGDATIDPVTIGNQPLRDRAAAKNLLYGAAVNPETLADVKLAAIAARECAILVPENELKWSFLRPTPNQFDFSQADTIARFAETHSLRLRGHTLVWNQQLPDWFEGTVNRRNAESIMVNHIQTVMGHYAGRIHSWDVVNEATAVAYSNRADGLQASPWLKFLGRDYLEIAFRAAAAADPQAILVHNETWLEYDTPRDNAQRAAVLRTLERLKAANVPIHALGIQAHLEASESRFNPKVLRSFLKAVADLGLKIIITELDVADRGQPADITVRDRAVANVYANYLSTVLEEPAVIGVLTWGLSDRYTWLTKFSPRADQAPVRSLPYDASMQRKAAWFALAQAFDRAPQRAPLNFKAALQK